MAIGAIAAGLGSLANVGMGIYDRAKSKQEYNKAQSFFEKNKYEIPSSAKASLDIAQRQASSLRMPGQSLAEERMGRNVASGVEQAKRVGTNPSDVLAMLSNLYGQQQQGEQNLAMQAANQYTANQRNFQNALGQYSNLENQKWQYNVLYPYQQMLGRAAQFSDRGAQELSSGVAGIMQTGAMAMQQASMDKQYEMWKQQSGFYDRPKQSIQPTTPGSQPVSMFPPSSSFTPDNAYANPHAGYDYNGVAKSIFGY